MSFKIKWVQGTHRNINEIESSKSNVQTSLSASSNHSSAAAFRNWKLKWPERPFRNRSKSTSDVSLPSPSLTDINNRLKVNTESRIPLTINTPVLSAIGIFYETCTPDTASADDSDVSDSRLLGFSHTGPQIFVPDRDLNPVKVGRFTISREIVESSYWMPVQRKNSRFQSE